MNYAASYPQPMANAPAKPVPPSPFVESIASLEDRIEMLAKTTAMLHERLDPIAHVAAPKPTTSSSSQITPSRSALNDRVCAASQRIETIRAAIDDLIERLDV